MLRQRIITAVIAGIALLAVLFVVPAWLARGVIAAVIVAAAWEWGRFLSPAAAGGQAGYAALVALMLAAAYLALIEGWLAAEALLAAGLLWWLAALGGLFLYPLTIPRWVAAAAGAFVLLPAWLAIDILYTRSSALLLFLLIVVWSADIGAFFAGRRFGRVKLAPRVSPGKTWEGVVGGLLLVAVVAAAGARPLGLPAAALLPFCLAVALLSIVGDLTVSVFKRSVGLKDSGRLFPGHGGLLDRIDSVTAAAPLFALGLAWSRL